MRKISSKNYGQLQYIDCRFFSFLYQLVIDDFHYKTLTSLSLMIPHLLSLLLGKSTLCYANFILEIIRNDCESLELPSVRHRNVCDPKVRGQSYFQLYLESVLLL